MEVSLLTSGSNRTLETVKVLHETILTLRTALEGSKKEIIELKKKNKFVSRVESDCNRENGTADSKLRRIFFLDQMDSPEKTRTEERVGSPQNENKLDSGAESDDIDDIELVFTTGETDSSSIHEDLVPIVEENARKSSLPIVVETDISKCGVLDDSEMNLMPRRNTLPNPLPNPLPYQPILHREILAASRMAPARSPCKVLLPGTQEMSAQTDITAVPGQWKSETYLAHKMSCNLTTLPSKFTLPVPQVKRLPLSDKTREARRVLLSDINFTSMVPELSRSADHLHDEKNTKSQTNAFEYKSPRTDKCCEYLRQDSRSTCGSYYGSRCYTSSTSIPPFACEEPRPKHSWRPPHVVCCHARHFWSSVPSSPIRCVHHRESEDNFCHLQPRKRKNKVHFHHCDPCGRSLPNLRMEGDSGDSTDSLVDEAEEFLRRSIDNLLLTKTSAKRRERSNSDADSTSSFEPPNASQPYLPKTIKDLKNDSFVKVITPGGKIAVGKVRYTGLVPGKAEPHVGVELVGDTGFSDGSFMGHRFFDCGTNHAVFVPFRKVVLAWNI